MSKYWQISCLGARYNLLVISALYNYLGLWKSKLGMSASLQQKKNQKPDSFFYNNFGTSGRLGTGILKRNPLSSYLNTVFIGHLRDDLHGVVVFTLHSHLTAD